MFAGFVTMNGVLLLFPEERPVFMREVRTHLCVPRYDR